jgi:magnesium-transporting ATPase (P-type)
MPLLLTTESRSYLSLVGDRQNAAAVAEKYTSSLRHCYPQPIDMCVHNSYDGKDTLWDNWELVKYTPFNPVDKRTVALVKNKATGELIRCSKGAPQVRILIGYRPH